ncbi:MAG: 2-phosphosulfolactate phosphatase [Planctomycetaceae bacterium]
MAQAAEPCYVYGMTRQLTVHLLPSLFEPADLQGGTAVMIDVLRASTTITHALAGGAAQIVPCSTIDEAQAIRTATDGCLLGGERGGEIIPGFDLGNSPAAYARDVVSGQTIAFTTTNGTRALLRSSQAAQILVGTFPNLDAVVGHLESADRPVHLVCAGTDGFVSTEDTLFAGAVCDRLELKADFVFNDAARLAQSHWQVCSRTEEALFKAILAGRGGQNVNRLGAVEDIRAATSRNGFDLVPEFLPQSRAIVLVKGQATDR